MQWTLAQETKQDWARMSLCRRTTGRPLKRVEHPSFSTLCFMHFFIEVWRRWLHSCKALILATPQALRMIGIFNIDLLENVELFSNSQIWEAVHPSRW